MAVDRNELAARIAAAQSGESIRGLFFNVLLQVATERAGEVAVARLKVARRAEGYSELRSYPVPEFLTLLFDIADLPVRAAASGRLASSNPEDVFYACGAASVQRFAKGIGQLVFGILGKSDPHRICSQVGMAYATSLSYGKRQYVQTGPKSGAFTFEHDMMPPSYHRGLIEETLRAVGCEGSVTVKVLGIDRVDYAASWA